MIEVGVLDSKDMCSSPCSVTSLLHILVQVNFTSLSPSFLIYKMEVSKNIQLISLMWGLKKAKPTEQPRTEHLLPSSPRQGVGQAMNSDMGLAVCDPGTVLSPFHVNPLIPHNTPQK